MLVVSREEAQEAINRAAHTQDGRILLYVLQQECGFMQNAMSHDPNVTQMLSAQRGVWGKFRKYIKPEALIEIEYRTKIEERKNDDG